MTGSYAASRVGEPQTDHAMQAPLPLVGTGPAVDFDAYATALEAAGSRSAEQVR
jgi:hypothetical protein